MDYQGIPMNGEVAGKRSTTKHRIEFPTHGTYHVYKTQTPAGGWKTVGHSTSDCDDDCSIAIKTPVRILNAYPQGVLANTFGPLACVLVSAIRSDDPEWVRKTSKEIDAIMWERFKVAVLSAGTPQELTP